MNITIQVELNVHEVRVAYENDIETFQVHNFIERMVREHAQDIMDEHGWLRPEVI